MTGITEWTALVEAGLTALVERESGRRLAALAGSDAHAAAAPRSAAADVMETGRPDDRSS